MHSYPFDILDHSVNSQRRIRTYSSVQLYCRDNADSVGIVRQLGNRAPAHIEYHCLHSLHDNGKYVFVGRAHWVRTRHEGNKYRQLCNRSLVVSKAFVYMCAKVYDVCRIATIIENDASCMQENHIQVKNLI